MAHNKTALVVPVGEKILTVIFIAFFCLAELEKMLVADAKRTDSRSDFASHVGKMATSRVVRIFIFLFSHTLHCRFGGKKSKYLKFRGGSCFYRKHKFCKISNALKFSVLPRCCDSA